MKKALLLIVLLTLAAPVTAILPGTVLFLPSVGKGPGSCAGGICAAWSTSAWIHNPGAEPATVEISFLQRNSDNSAAPPSASMTVAPGATLQLLDIMTDPFELDGVFGSMRFVSNVPIVVTGRIEDTNVETHRGQGTAGQFFGGMSILESLGKGEAPHLIGLAEEGSGGAHRSNFGLAEVTGLGCEVTVERLDGEGNVFASRVYTVLGFSQIQHNVSHVGGDDGTNQMLRVRITGGSGRVLPFASFIDNLTGDPSSIIPTQVNSDPSLYAGTWRGRGLNSVYPHPRSVTELKAVIGYSPGAQKVTMTLEGFGHFLGVEDPPPETFTGGKLQDGGFRFIGSSEVWGTYDIVINPLGTISGTLQDFPVQTYAEKVELYGRATQGAIALAVNAHMRGAGIEPHYYMLQRE